MKIPKHIENILGELKKNGYQAYLVGGSMFEKIIEFLEDWEDTRAIKSLKKSDWGKGKDLNQVAKELGLKL